MPYDARAHMRAQRWQFYPTVPTIPTRPRTPMACAHAHPTNKARPQARPRDTHMSRTCSHTSLLAEWGKKHRPVRVLGQPRSQAQTSRLWDIADGSRGELGLGDIGGIGRSLVLDFHHRWRENGRGRILPGVCCVDLRILICHLLIELGLGQHDLGIDPLLERHAAQAAYGNLQMWEPQQVICTVWRGCGCMGHSPCRISRCS